MTAPPATLDPTPPVAPTARRPPVTGRPTPSSAVGAPSAPRPDTHESLGRKRSLRRILRLIAGFGAAIALVTLLALQRSTLAGSVSALTALRWRWIPVVVLAQLLSLEAVARTHRQLLRVSGVVMHPRPIRTIVYASTAISVSLPLAGSQVSVGYSLRELVRRGADSAAVAWMLVASGIAATTAFALLIAAGTAATGNPAAVIIAVGGTLLAVIPALLLLPALRRPAVRRIVERLVIGLLGRYQRLTRRPLGTPARVVHDFLSRLASYRATPRQQVAVLGLALVNWLADCLCLTAAIAAVGAPIPWQGLLLAYVGAAGVNSLGLTPGGLGVVEAALTAGLVAAGLDGQHALAATLIYRLANFWLVMAAGWVVFGVSSRSRPLDRTGAVAAPLAGDGAVTPSSRPSSTPLPGTPTTQVPDRPAGKQSMTSICCVTPKPGRIVPRAAGPAYEGVG